MNHHNQWTIENARCNLNCVPERDSICVGLDILDDAYEHINMEWIGIDKFILNLSAWLSDHVKLNGVPIVLELLRNGLNAYVSILHRTEKRYFPHERLNAFLMGCLSAAASFCAYKVVDGSTGEVWSIHSDQSFLLWRKGRPSLSVTDAIIDGNEAVRVLYANTVPRNLQLAMRRFGHEATIMASGLDYRH